MILQVNQDFPDGSVHVVPVLYPTGRAISKDERERAERLHSFLAKRMPEIEEEITDLGIEGTNDLQKWHALGQRLTFVDDPDLVGRDDRESGSIWLAVRQHATELLLPKGEVVLDPKEMASRLSGMESQRRLGKRHDHFERCQRLGELDLEYVDWLTWSEFDAYLESPGLVQDSRILPLLAHRAKAANRKLKRAEVRSLFKNLREAFPTKRRQRDTTGLPEEELLEVIETAFGTLGL